MSTRHAVVDTLALGEVTLVARDDSIVGLYFRHHWFRPADEVLGVRVEVAGDALLAEAARQLDEYLDGSRTAFDLPTEADGDEFQERVWRLLGQIPRGETVTYGELAARLGDRSLAQQVGQAVGRNPLCVIVPCHRVVGANGRLTGYAGGLGRKQALLALEEPPSVVAGKLF
jgi:methylated-DNA-[protein]-cysteine S-methyltransferase